MATAFQHRPLSKILVPDADPTPAEQSAEAPSTPKQDKTPESTLPEKYRGKTAEEIAEMHANAEKELGRVRNELGTYRGLVSDLSSLQRPTSEPSTAEQEVELSGDEMISDPVGSIKKVVQNELRPITEKSQADALEQQIRMETSALEAQFEDYSQTVLSEEFKTFANRTPSRQQDLNVAATGEGLAQVRAARRLLEDFTDFQESTKAQETPTEETPVEKAKKVATESGRSGAPISSKPLIRESEVIELINSDPVKYRSPSFQRELTAAIKEGRFVKNT